MDDLQQFLEFNSTPALYNPSLQQDRVRELRQVLEEWLTKVSPLHRNTSLPIHFSSMHDLAWAQRLGYGTGKIDARGYLQSRNNLLSTTIAHLKKCCGLVWLDIPGVTLEEELISNIYSCLQWYQIVDHHNARSSLPMVSDDSVYWGLALLQFDFLDKMYLVGNYDDLPLVGFALGVLGHCMSGGTFMWFNLFIDYFYVYVFHVPTPFYMRSPWREFLHSEIRQNNLVALNLAVSHVVLSHNFVCRDITDTLRIHHNLVGVSWICFSHIWSCEYHILQWGRQRGDMRCFMHYLRTRFLKRTRVGPKDIQPVFKELLKYDWINSGEFLREICQFYQRYARYKHAVERFDFCSKMLGGSHLNQRRSQKRKYLSD